MLRSAAVFACLFASCVTAKSSWAQTELTPGGKADFARVFSPQADRVAISKTQPFVFRAARDSYNRLLSWNELAMEVTAADHARGPNLGYDQLGPHRASRAIAMVHIAMYDAVNAITRKYKAYTPIPDADAKACVDTALSEAARDILIKLFPREGDRIQDAYRRDQPWALAACQAQQTDAKLGKTIGTDAADRIFKQREQDGSNFVEREFGTEQQATDHPERYVYIPADAGKWQPDPVSKIRTVLGYDWGKVKPFVLQDVDSLLPGPPPKLDSAAYAAQFNQVKAIGAVDSITRKEFEAFGGVFWAYDGTPELCAPPRLYNQFALQVVEQNALGMHSLMDTSDLARFLALINTAMADTAIVTWKAKWQYAFWRPITAIQFNGDDGNPETIADPAWQPLGAPATNGRGPNFTPPFPAYPSGHAAFGGALFEIMRAFYAEETSVAFVSDEYNGLNKDVNGNTRAYRSMNYFNFQQPEWENAQSRLWLGIHWQSDATDGITTGNKVADEVLKLAFTPR